MVTRRRVDPVCVVPRVLDRPETCQRPASCGKVLEQSAGRAAVVGGFPAGGLRYEATLALVHMAVNCETWRDITPRCYSGAEGPHFSLALFGPLNPTRAVTSPAWKLPPRSEMLSCRCSSPKSRSRLRPLPQAQAAGTTCSKSAAYSPVARHLAGADHRLRRGGRLADGRHAGTRNIIIDL